MDEDTNKPERSSANNFLITHLNIDKYFEPFNFLKDKTPDEIEPEEYQKVLEIWNATWWNFGKGKRSEDSSSITSVIEYSNSKAWHIHSLICAKNRLFFDKFKKLWPKAHIDIVNGSYAENYAYLTKTGEKHKDKKYQVCHPPVCYGKWLKTHKDKELTRDEEIMQAIEQGQTPEEICRNSLYACRNKSAIEELFYIKQKENIPPEIPVRCIYSIGASGTGKTEYTRRTLKKQGITAEDYYIPIFDSPYPFDNLKWWKAKILWIQELEPEHLETKTFSYKSFLKLFEPETNIQLQRRYKNADLKMWDTIYINTTYAPEEIYPMRTPTDNSFQFIRRIDKIIYHCIDPDYPFDDDRRYKRFILENPKENYKNEVDLIAQAERYFGRKIKSGALTKEQI